MEKMEIVIDYLFVALLFSTLVLVIFFVFWLILNVISEIRDFFKEKKEEKKSLEFTFSTDKMILGQMCLREVDSSDHRKTSETLKTSQDKSPSLNVGGFFSEKEGKVYRMKKSGVTFDFGSLIKGAAGAGGIVLTPTVHISKDGNLSFYCINEEETYHQFRMAKSGEKVGIELLETSKDNSYALRKSRTAFVGRISCLSDYLDLDFFLGTDFYLGNFPLYQQSENVWWFDLKEAHSKRKPLKKKSKHPIKALRS